MTRDLRPTVACLLALGLCTGPAHAAADAGAVPATRPAPAVPAAEIAALVKQLGSEDFPTRRSAEARLVALGEPALPALRRAVADDADEEVVANARRAIARITGWGEAGPVAEGLQLRLAAALPRVPAGEPVVLTIGVRNVADGERPVRVPTGVNIVTSGRGYMSTENFAQVTVKRLSGKPVEGGVFTKACGVAPRAVAQRLAPGTTLEQRLVLRPGEDDRARGDGKNAPPELSAGLGPALPPGRYEVTLEVRPSPEAGTVGLRSNALVFEVVDAE